MGSLVIFHHGLDPGVVAVRPHLDSASEARHMQRRTPQSCAEQPALSLQGLIAGSGRARIFFRGPGFQDVSDQLPAVQSSALPLAVSPAVNSRAAGPWQ